MDWFDHCNSDQTKIKSYFVKRKGVTINTEPNIMVMVYMMYILFLQFIKLCVIHFVAFDQDWKHVPFQLKLADSWSLSP